VEFKHGGERGAPTDGFLELLSERMRRFNEMNSSKVASASLELETASRDAESLADMSAAETSFRLATREEFATFVGHTPDEIPIVSRQGAAHILRSERSRA